MKRKIFEMLLDSAEAVLSIFRFNRSLFGFDKKKRHWWDELKTNVRKTLRQQEQSYKIGIYHESVPRCRCSVFVGAVYTCYLLRDQRRCNVR